MFFSFIGVCDVVFFIVGVAGWCGAGLPGRLSGRLFGMGQGGLFGCLFGWLVLVGVAWPSAVVAVCLLPLFSPAVAFCSATMSCMP